MRLAAFEGRLILIVMEIIAISLVAASPQEATPQSAPTPGSGSRGSKASALSAKLPKVWHSEGSKHDFRVEMGKDVFRAEWVNIPPAAAKQGAYIRTECRRSGAKWVGSSSVNMLFGVPGAPAGKDTKICHLTVRFEVDSITPEKITGHSEAVKDFDVNTCQLRKSSWGEFTWTPKQSGR